ncbi:MAG: hypothetical protein QMC81_02835 [Thermoanaerobacterales bacterium]|nr:hypothetical protein [Thermoanaerobacterales bacterium]
MWWMIAEWQQADFVDCNGCNRVTRVLVPLTGSRDEAEMRAELERRRAAGRPVVLLTPEQMGDADADVFSLPRLEEGM